MSVNAREEDYEHVELFGSPALMTVSRIDRSTLPHGWFCYDLRGSDYDPESPIMLEDSVTINHAGTILSPTALKKPDPAIRRRIDGKLNFIGEYLNLSEFCKEHGLEFPDNQHKYILRPASPEEAGIFYALTPERDAELGTIGHVRIDFGSNGKEFWHTWHPRGDENLNCTKFKAELTELINQLRATGPLKDLNAMTSYCSDHGGAIENGWRQNYGYTIDTENYRYCLRCSPGQGDYHAYLTAYDLRVQQMNMAEKDLVGKVSFPSGEEITYRDADEYINAVKEELPYHSTSGFRYYTITDDPQVRKAVDDLLYDLYGEENPRQLDDYDHTPAQGMTMGGM